jgi:trans-aconitate methyltransferase
MRHRDAVDLIAGAGFDASSPSVWADLGCGDGRFTCALASLLAPGSVVHAIDRDAAALSRLRACSSSVRISPHILDFVSQPWPVESLQGILMANSLHYVRAQRAFVSLCASRLAPGGHFLVVEYDTEVANPWVPHPVSRAALSRLFNSVRLSVRFLGARRSVVGRAQLYTAVASRGIIGGVGA